MLCIKPQKKQRNDPIKTLQLIRTKNKTTGLKKIYHDNNSQKKPVEAIHKEKTCPRRNSNPYCVYLTKDCQTT